MPSKHDTLKLAMLQKDEKIKALQSELRSLQKEAVTTQNVRECIFQLSSTPPTPPDWVLNLKEGLPDAGLPNFVFSDWHINEVIQPNEVAGANRFDLAIATKRVQKLAANCIRLPHLIKTKNPYNGCIAWVLGDMVAGDIHEELRETNEFTSFQSLLKTADLVIWLLTQLADTYGRVHVPWVVGNHGRNSKKPRSKRRVYNNFDWLIGAMVERHFKTKEDNRVTIDLAEGIDVRLTIYGHRYRGVHGDSMGVMGGNALIGNLGPIMRGDIKQRRMQDSLPNDMGFDTLIQGHWHTARKVENIIVNGCLCGYNEYAYTMGMTYARPSQTFFIHHPEMGRVWHNEIYLDHVRKSKAKHAIKNWQRGD